MTYQDSEQLRSFYETLDDKYHTVDDLTTQSNTYRVAFYRDRRSLDGKLDKLSDMASPIHTVINEYKTLRKRLDALIIGAWHRGVRARDGNLQVVQKPGRSIWSKAAVEQACEQFGVSYSEFARAAGLPSVVTSVKVR
jgi:hypothetical protein